MSLFQTTEIACPICSTPVSFDLVVSLSADRRPDLRQAVLDGSFQRKDCPSCGTSFRVDPEFTFIDVQRGQYIGAWPIGKRIEWQACAERTVTSFDLAFGKRAGPEARDIGKKLQPRAVFGWAALVEKLIANEAGIDDASLETAKVYAVSTLESAPLPGRQEFRLVNVIDGDLVFAWVRTDDGTVSDGLQMPRRIIAEIESNPAAWQEVRSDVAEGVVVDFQREMLAR